MTKSIVLILFTQLLAFNSYGQQHEVVAEAESRHRESGYFVCHEYERWSTMKEAWAKAKSDAIGQCGSNVQLREKIDEHISCPDFGTTVYARVEARFACVDYNSYKIPSPYCENSYCE